MRRISGLIAAAGKGSRSGLSYPKTLFEVDGKPILVRILELMNPFVDSTTVVVSPDGHSQILECLKACHLVADLVVQSKPLGMGDAVLRFVDSSAYRMSEDILLIWGDVPFIQRDTIDKLIHTHTDHENHFTFVTKHAGEAYTVVSRTSDGNILGVQETREAGALEPVSGERDIGLFLFNREVVFSFLQKELPGKYGGKTGEHGFLYVIEHLVSQGYRVEGLPIAHEVELISLNSLKDLEKCAV